MASPKRKTKEPEVVEVPVVSVTTSERLADRLKAYDDLDKVLDRFKEVNKGSWKTDGNHGENLGKIRQLEAVGRDLLIATRRASYYEGL